MMKIVDILYENTKGNERFVTALIPKLTHWYDNLYPDTDWFNAAYNVVNTQKGPYEYRAAAMNANIQIEELNKLTSSAGSMLNMDIDQLLSFRKKYQTLIKSINDNINLLVHLRDMFTSMRQGNFMEIYSVPIGVMVELWTRWIKEVYTPESQKRELSYGGHQLMPISRGDFMGESNPVWEKYNPIFGQQDFWKSFNTHGMGEKTYVTSSYLENERGDEPLMFVARDVEMMYDFVANAEMEMAINDISQYFSKVGARKVINYIRSKPGWQYDDEELDVNEEIGLDIKKYVDEHPEIDFNTDGDADETFTYIGQILNDYLHY